MKPEEMRVAIAEKCGFKPGSFMQWSGKLQGTFIHNGQRNDCDVPDYCNDLNAMHGAWGMLDRFQRHAYSKSLWEVVVNSGGHASSSPDDIAACVENATAAQRAEAFCRVFWPERFQ